MSSQKSQNIQKTGISLQMIRKPTLLQCSSVSCYDCYLLYPNGFYCPEKNKDILTGQIKPRERKTFEDHVFF